MTFADGHTVQMRRIDDQEESSHALMVDPISKGVPDAFWKKFPLGKCRARNRVHGRRAAEGAAQAPLGSSTTEPYTPAADAKDLKAVLFNWMRNMGMLKGTTSATWSPRSNIREMAPFR